MNKALPKALKPVYVRRPMTTITIFGASGFLGRHIVRQLAKTGATIRVPTRDPDKALILKPMGDVGQIVPFRASVRSDASVDQAIGASDVVINLIGILYEKGRDTFQALHVEAPARIARLAREHGAKKFIHVSAIGADANSKSAYARSKAAGEQAVHTFFPDATIFRPSIVFGPEDSFFNRFARLSSVAPALPLIGGGLTKFQPVYVGDVAEAVKAALGNPDAVGETYELGGPSVYSFKELMELMLKETGRKRFLTPIPWPLAKLKATFLELMPTPLLTRDQVELLKSDNVVRSKAKTLRHLNITPTAVEIVVPRYFNKG